MKVALAKCVLGVLLISIAFGAYSESIRFGVVPQFEQSRLLRTWRPVLDAVEDRSELRFKFVGRPSITAFEAAFQAGEFGCAYMNPYHLLVANDAQGYTPVVRSHARSLQGVLVVRRDGDFEKVSQLEGKRLAFPAPNALGASLLMRAELATQMDLDIRPVYVNSHSSVYLNVVTGRMAAGGGVQRTLDSQRPSIRRALRVVYRTEAVPPHPIACHPRVTRQARRQLRAAFLDLTRELETQRLLNRIPMRRPGPAELSEYEGLKALNLERFYETP